MDRSSEKRAVESVAEFINEVFSTIGSLGNEKVIWFRGEGSINYKLVPTFYRYIKSNKEVDYWHKPTNAKEVYEIEQEIDMSFYRKASVFFSESGIKNTPWNRYFLKQHYGVQTRLLDWTENALYALFFAVNNTTLEKDGRVWLLSPFKLNKYTFTRLAPDIEGLEVILTCGKLPNKKRSLIGKNQEVRTTELLRKYYRMDCKDGKEMYPLAIYPPHLDQRMTAQQACFTLFGNVITGLNESGNENFISYINISAGSKIKIQKELHALGFSNYSIYPDLDGLGKTINNSISNKIYPSKELESIIENNR